MRSNTLTRVSNNPGAVQRRSKLCRFLREKIRGDLLNYQYENTIHQT